MYTYMYELTILLDTLLDATRRYSTLLDATRRYSTLLDATRRYCILLIQYQKCAFLDATYTYTCTCYDA
jgi:hypothetical protein